MTGLNLRTLRDWIAKGYVTPALPPKKTGSRVYLNFTDLLEINLTIQCRSYFSMRKIQRIKQVLREYGWVTASPYWLDLSGSVPVARFETDKSAFPQWAVLDIEALKARVLGDALRLRGVKH